MEFVCVSKLESFTTDDKGNRDYWYEWSFTTFAEEVTHISLGDRPPRGEFVTRTQSADSYRVGATYVLIEKSRTVPFSSRRSEGPEKVRNAKQGEAVALTPEEMEDYFDRVNEGMSDTV